MYRPKHFLADNQEAIDKIVQENPFAIIVTSSKNTLNSNHIPLELEGSVTSGGKLHGHMAYNNPQLEEIKNSNDILVIFMGPHQYISPTWYKTPAVPTWNYVAVHCYGHGKIETNPDLILARLEQMVQRYDGSHWSIDMLPPDHKTKSLAGITSFSIEIERVEAKFKLSQNKSAIDRQSVYNHLKMSGDENSKKTAKLMEQYSQIDNKKA